MTKGIALIYCRLVTLVLNWSNMLQTSSAERLHLSSAKKPQHNWDLGSSLHDLKPLPSFTVTGCQIHTDEWTDPLNFTLRGEDFLPHAWSLLQRLILDTVCCLAPLCLSLFSSCPGYYCLFYSQWETKHWATIASHNRKKYILHGWDSFLWQRHRWKTACYCPKTYKSARSDAVNVTVSPPHKPARRGTDGYCQQFLFERLGRSQSN